MDEIPTIAWKLVGVILIAAGILIWFPKFRRQVAGVFAVYMLVFTIVHLAENTYDIGGSVFMTLLLGLLVWNPKFIEKNILPKSRA